jgi:hypothetical protein
MDLLEEFEKKILGPNVVKFFQCFLEKTFFSKREIFPLFLFFASWLDFAPKKTLMTTHH